jgi:hypothetical protein
MLNTSKSSGRVTLLGALPVQRGRERLWNNVSSFHLVPHFEKCSPSVTVNCEVILLGELHGTFSILTVAGLKFELSITCNAIT